MFWFLTGFIIFADGTTWTLYAIQNALMKYRFGVGETDGAYIVGYHFLLQVFLRPLIGYIAD